MNAAEMREQRSTYIAQAKEALSGEFTDEAQKKAEGLMAQADALKAKIALADKVEAEARALDQADTPANKPVVGAPAVLKIGLGDNETRAMAHYVRTGDGSGLKRPDDEWRTSNDTSMNFTTDADGKVLIPVGHYQGIIAKRDTVMLAPRLGVRNIPGQGTTVNVPVDNGTANVFVSVGESTAFDRDAPALAKVEMTLVTYTKRIELTYELMQDEDSKLMAFLDDYVGRALALTHNSLLLTAALAGGTTKALAAAAAATATDINGLVYSLKAEYLDNAAWVMARATEAAYRNIASSSVYTFNNTPLGAAGMPGTATLAGYPVYNSASMPAIGGGYKSLAFGNWNYVGLREAPSITVLRDPYGGAKVGEVWMHYYFRCVYKVLVAEALYYGTHPTA